MQCLEITFEPRKIKSFKKDAYALLFLHSCILLQYSDAISHPTFDKNFKKEGRYLLVTFKSTDLSSTGSQYILT